MRDLKWIFWLLVFSLLALVVCSVCFVYPVSADAADYVIANTSYAISDTSGYAYHAPYRLPYQGASVYINDTVDISGQGWGEGIAWYGKYGEYELPQYIREFTPYPKDQRAFYLDPMVFAGRSGVWYQYYGNGTERNGNLVSFRLIDAFRPEENVTVENVTPEVKQPEFILPAKPVADYLIAKGGSLAINESRIWVFGRVDGLYGISGGISNQQIQNLEDGSYKLILQDSGNNTIPDIGYNPDKDSLWRISYDDVLGSTTILDNVNALQPMLTMEHFIELIGHTDDKIQTYNLDIEEPAISIVSIDEVDVGNRIPVNYEPGMTLLDVRGYTNTANGTKLTFIMDEDKQTVRTLPKNTFTTQAMGNEIGNERFYRIYIPINKNQMYNGIHTITASTAIGGKMYYDFPILELPADSFVPNATIKYMGDRNPWAPNLTIPEPVIVTVPGPNVTVIVEVPPSNETVYANQKLAADAVNAENWDTFQEIAKWFCAIVMVSCLILYVITVIWRRKQE